MKAIWQALVLSLLALLVANAQACKCKNGGTCYDWPSGTTRCNCPRGYIGKYCEQPRGLLRVKVKTGANLRDRDGPAHGKSDPYVEIVATDHVGNKKKLRTRTDHNDQSPEWNQWLDFGVDTWDKMTMQIFDYDSHNGPDALSSLKKGVLEVLGSTNYRIEGHRGYVEVYIVYSRPPSIGVPGIQGLPGPSSG